MDFTDEELRELSAFLARRLTPELRPLTQVEVLPDAIDAWELRLFQARTAGTLGQLVKEASQVLPRDPYLREASALLDPPTRTQSWLTGGVMVLAAAVLVCISLAGFATTGVLAAIETAGPGRLALAEAAPTLPENELAAAGVVSSPTVAATRAGDDGLDAVAPLVAPELALEAAARVPRVEDGPPEGPLEPAVEDDRACKVGGWVYAGTTPVERTWVVPFALHVRAAPPSKENGWNARTPTRCWLQKGDVVRLAEPALKLPGGHYWLHVAPMLDDVAWADTGH